MGLFIRKDYFRYGFIKHMLFVNMATDQILFYKTDKVKCNDIL